MATTSDVRPREAIKRAPLRRCMGLLAGYRKTGRISMVRGISLRPAGGVQRAVRQTRPGRALLDRHLARLRGAPLRVTRSRRTRSAAGVQVSCEIGTGAAGNLLPEAALHCLHPLDRGAIGGEQADQRRRHREQLLSGRPPAYLRKVNKKRMSSWLQPMAWSGSSFRSVTAAGCMSDLRMQQGRAGGVVQLDLSRLTLLGCLRRSS